MVTATTSQRAVELCSAYSDILNELQAAAAQRGGAAPAPAASLPRLVAVSKRKPSGDILALHDHGVRHFGENYPQELVDKAKELPSDIAWHFIGALQSNKCKMLASIPNLFAIETLTSIKSANLLNTTLSNLSPSRSTPLHVYLQVNTSGEEQKAGLDPATTASSELVTLAAHILTACPHLRLYGLMTIGSFESSTADGERNPDFDVLVKARDALLAALRDQKANLGDAWIAVEEQGLELSMGMSEDFVQAIKQGASSVRVGSRIFGARPAKV